jgi:pimeloyl-ACP methyl ester carboxylesterase
MNTLWSQRPVRAAGDRSTVIGLHTAAGAPDQWRPLAERLRLHYRVLAPDLHAYAAGRASGAHQPLSLHADTALIEPLLDAFPGPVYLVGQDYGASVALKLAHRRRERIGGLVLYEPTPFGLGIPGCRPGHRGPAARARALCRRGRLVPGRSALCGPPLGPDAWQGLSTRERAAIAWRMPSYARSLTPKSRIRRRSPGSPGSTYRYGS